MDVKPKTHSSRHLSQVAPNNTQAANKTQAAPAVPEEVNEQLVKNIEAKKVDQAYTKQIQEIIADINSLEKNSDEAALAAGCLDLCLSSLNLLLDSDEQLSIVHSPQQYLQNLRDAQELSKVVEKKLSPPISENTKSNKSTGALSDKEAKLTSIKDGEIPEDISLDDGPKTTSQPEKEYIAMGEHNFFSKELANKLQELASIVSNQAQLKANKLSRKLEKAEQDPYSYVPQELISKSLAAQKTEQIHRQLGQIINHLEAKFFFLQIFQVPKRANITNKIVPIRVHTSPSSGSRSGT